MGILNLSRAVFILAEGTIVADYRRMSSIENTDLRRSQRNRGYILPMEALQRLGRSIERAQLRSLPWNLEHESELVHSCL